MKSILVIDTPGNCSECPIKSSIGYGKWCVGSDDMCIDTYPDRPYWCPIKPLPIKYNMLDVVFDRDYNGEYEYGYNACIDEILYGV